MTEISFHFNVADKWEYSCRLLRKAAGTGARTAVMADPVDLQRLDRRLWELDPVEFLAHCLAERADGTMREASAVVLCESLAAAPHDQVLLNLGPGVAAGFERFARLIEVVGCDEGERVRARARWKYYTSRGYAIIQRDRAGKDAH